MANSPAMTKVDKEYQAECDLRSLIEAEKIRKDKARLSAAMKSREKQMMALAAIDKEKGKS